MKKTMTFKQLKTVDVEAMEHWDEYAGNSYFSAIITLNEGMSNQEKILLPFQYGYGSHFEYEAKTELQKRFPRTKWAKDNFPMWGIRQFGKKYTANKIEGKSERACKRFVKGA